ncbi:MAG: BrnT family toxin [Oligoflexia bacterium]|nr:BrnT family toxin [Oligoflexia bacterium]
MYNVNMELKFVWDRKKNKLNQDKHGVSFEEAKTVFLNFPLEIFFDPDHSGSEDRYIAFGYSNKDRVLLVVHIENIRGTEIRIISARKATRQEIRQVFGG